jgi:hypothetical protein
MAVDGSYVCPQCGPDPTGPEVLAELEAHPVFMVDDGSACQCSCHATSSSEPS